MRQRDWSDGEIGADRPSAEVTQPERRLMRAVLADAVRTVATHGHAADVRAERLQREAMAWIASEERSSTFSFENICETLGIDPSWLRASLEPIRAINSGAKRANGQRGGSASPGRWRG